MRIARCESVCIASVKKNLKVSIGPRPDFAKFDECRMKRSAVGRNYAFAFQCNVKEVLHSKRFADHLKKLHGS